jgi:hypothetical protein
MEISLINELKTLEYAQKITDQRKSPETGREHIHQY